jgi:hypothetical protein
VLRALSRHVGRHRIIVARDREDYGRAIVDERVTIDVMCAAWNIDAAVQRLARLNASPADQRPDGYLHVVDATADAARVRIELALSPAPFDAILAVWRRDHPAEQLTTTLDALPEQSEVAPRSD